MYWVLYDIASTRKRNRMVRLCEDFGLRRVQKSCFAGNLASKKVKLFCEKTQEFIAPEDSVIVFPMPENVVGKVMILGKGTLPSASDHQEVLFL